MVGFFNDFKKQMKQKGLIIDMENRESDSKKSDLLEALEKQLEAKQQGPQVHGDHGSFTRHSSNSATEEEKEIEDIPSMNPTKSM